MLKFVVWPTRRKFPFFGIRGRIRILSHAILALRGWRLGVTFSAFVTSLVLILNIALCIWATTFSSSMKNGVGTIYKGSCAKTSCLNMLLHLAINILSTTLLSASNYTMQCLSSPTRQELDVVHAKGTYLDIGVPSLRNLKSISIKRSVCWLLLAFSSIPLHLLYNSTVFEALGSYEYKVYVVADGFFSGAPFDQKGPWNDTGEYLKRFHDDVTYKQSIGKFDFLDKQRCISEYSTRLIAGRNDLLLMTKDIPSLTEEPFRLVAISDSGWDSEPSWMCGKYYNYCDRRQIASAPEWIVSGFSVQYCLSEVVEERCEFQFSQIIVIIVIICNIIKVCCMVYAVTRVQESVICTLGDAVQSYLDQQDSVIAEDTLSTITSLRNVVCQLCANKVKAQQGLSFSIRRKRWFSSSSWKRWITCIVFCSAILSITCWLLQQAVNTHHSASRPTSIQSFWSEGFGKVDMRSIVNFPQSTNNSVSLTEAVLLVNLPQLILSFSYLLYNSLYTCMLMDDEWNQFAIKRKTLRVSSPTGKQRSTYFLELPYRYALPLIFVFGLMHWLVSQTIFLARINFIDFLGEVKPEKVLNGVGYSTIAIIFVLFVGGIMLIMLILIGCRRYKSYMPLTGHCSATIRTACYRLPEDVDAAVLPLKWGLIGDDDENVGRCGFSSGAVRVPQHDQVVRIKMNREDV